MALKEKKRSELERLREYASLLSHNLKTPITGIKMMTAILESSNDMEEMRKGIKDLHKATVSLEVFYRDMEQVYKQIHMPPDPPQKVLLSDELKKVKDHLQGHILASEAKIEVDLSGGDAIVFRPTSINSILLNLLSNAIKYAKPDTAPEITVKTAPHSSSFILLEVSDNGIGINLDKYGDKVFGLFEKFTDHPDATGMGLYITKNQVESMGGEIWLNSTPGEGSTFSLTLPSADD